MAPLNDARGVQFTAPLAEVRMDKSGDPDAKGQWTFRGHAAVFNRKSHDLGGFRTVIAPGFFTKILDTSPDVHLNREHDMRLLLARTLSSKSKLELREDPYGLHAYARFVKTALAEETAALMDAGVLDQMSFACDIALDRWEEDEGGEITRYLLDCGGLYDVAICAQGAFPQTDSQLLASVHDAGALLASAQEAGRVIRRVQDPDLVASRGETADDGIAQPEVEAEGAADVAGREDRLAALKDLAAARYSAATAVE
jgi:HK97 family phage prohead protease